MASAAGGGGGLELTFEQVMFGDELDGCTSPSRADDFDDDRAASPGGPEDDSPEIEDGEDDVFGADASVGSHRRSSVPSDLRKPRVRRDSYTRREQARRQQGEKGDANCVVVRNLPYAAVGDLIQTLERDCGAVRQHHFSEGAEFGFVQFRNPESVNAALEQLNNAPFAGCTLVVERCARITPGIDPRSSAGVETKNRVLVLKNLPFSMREEDLQHTLGNLPHAPPPVSLQMFFDANGLFRGTSFATYTTVSEAEAAYAALNGAEIGGRVIRAEFKRADGAPPPGASRQQRPGQGPYEPTDEDSRRIHEQLKAFLASDRLVDLAFPPTLSSTQRKTVHVIAEALGLCHASSGDGEQRYIRVWKRAEGRSQSMSQGDDGRSRARTISGSQSRPRAGTASGRSYGSYNDAAASQSPTSASQGSQFGRYMAMARSLGTSAAAAPSTSPTGMSRFSQNRRTSAAEGGGGVGSSSTGAISPGLPAPVRQPRGPDGTSGFAVDRPSAGYFAVARSAAVSIPTPTSGASLGVRSERASSFAGRSVQFSPGTLSPTAPPPSLASSVGVSLSTSSPSGVAAALQRKASKGEIDLSLAAKSLLNPQATAFQFVPKNSM